MKTAVEFLVEKLDPNIMWTEKALKVFEQANQMFEEQIVEACNQTEFEDIDGMGIHETITKGEQYYNETYKNEKQ